MEEAISRLALALEELEEKRREEEIHRSVGENWKKIARTIDRCLLKTRTEGPLNLPQVFLQNLKALKKTQKVLNNLSLGWLEIPCRISPQGK